MISYFISHYGRLAALGLGALTMTIALLAYGQGQYSKGRQIEKAICNKEKQETWMQSLPYAKNRIERCALLIMMLILNACESARHDTRETMALLLPPVLSYESAFYKRLANEAQDFHCPAHIEWGRFGIFNGHLTRAEVMQLEAGVGGLTSPLLRGDARRKNGCGGTDRIGAAH